jgi:hypothetical protein
MVVAILCATAFPGRHVSAQSTSGMWTAFPSQTTVYSAIVRPPVKADGSSVFRNGNAIPLKFKLMTAPSAFTFDSVWSNNCLNLPPETPCNPPGGEPVTNDDFSFLSFAPSAPLTFAQLTNLKANYEFTTGNCQGGSLRWSVTFDIGNDNGTIPGEGDPDPTANDRSIFIYYGDYPNFGDCTSGANDQTGINMIGLSDLRYDTSQLGGTFYDTYANALNLVDGDSETAALNIASVTLALDSGWMQDSEGNFKDQKVDLASAQVNDNTFTPITGNPTATCDLPAATITVVEETNGPVDFPLSVQRRVTDTFYRNTNDCTYSYSLATNSLFGPGNYAAYVVIGSSALNAPARFILR